MVSSKILVVDDDANLLELVKMRLESAGYDVAAMLEGEMRWPRLKRSPLTFVYLTLC